MLHDKSPETRIKGFWLICSTPSKTSSRTKSIGAAVIAGVGAGELAWFEEVVKFNERYEKNALIEKETEVYERIKPVFEMAFYEALKKL
ncbi:MULTISPECIES: hypothetical protein [Blautia]|uniref:hypothetical protein n=1 Tax=Blautia TaxID=572511 RepID=UPI000BA343E3|nr:MULTISPECIES: hypothetical protein [Blautia]